jgi:hypothetical protein
MYVVTVEKSLALVRVACDGFLSVPEVLATGREMRAQIDRLRPFTNGVKAIVICSPMAQRADVVLASQGDKWTMPHPHDRLAIIVTSALMKLQVNRSYTAEREGIFYTEEEGRAWLGATPASDLPIAMRA